MGPGHWARYTRLWKVAGPHWVTMSPRTIFRRSGALLCLLYVFACPVSSTIHTFLQCTSSQSTRDPSSTVCLGQGPPHPNDSCGLVSLSDALQRCPWCACETQESSRCSRGLHTRYQMGLSRTTTMFAFGYSLVLHVVRITCHVSLWGTVVPTPLSFLPNERSAEMVIKTM